MEFKYMYLGTNLKKAVNGFMGKGDWDLLKCFYKDEEFYLNINKKTGEAEIIAKNGYSPQIIKGIKQEFK